MLGVTILALVLLVPAAISRHFETQGAEPLPDPVAWWKLDEAPGATSFIDSSGNGNTGSCTAPACPLMGISGRFGTAGEFDGANDRIVVSDSASLDVTRATLSAWVNLDTIDATGQREIEKLGSYILRIDGSGNVVWNSGGLTDNTVTCLNPGLPLMEWVHLSATYDGAMIRVYINAVECKAEPSTGNLAITANVVSLGNTGSGASAIDGGFDEIRIYNTGLPAGQIAVLAGVAPAWTPFSLVLWALIPLAIVAFLLLLFTNRGGKSA